MTQLAERTKLIKPSVTLAIAAKAGKLRAEGVDVVNFSAGEPDFDTPEHIKAAAVEALRKGMTKYTDVKGIEPLREAIADMYRRTHDLTYRKDDVVVSCGAKHSIYNLLQAVVNPGDEVVIPAPYWVSYADMALLAGGIPKADSVRRIKRLSHQARATRRRLDASRAGVFLKQPLQSDRRKLQQG